MKHIAHSKQRLTTKNVGYYCMVSGVTIRRWIRAGKLTAIKLPSGHYRIDPSAFRDFLERWHLPVEDWLLEANIKKEET
jgi:excisionase family DNA binding protein